MRSRTLAILGFTVGVSLSGFNTPAIPSSHCSDTETWTGTSAANTRYDDGDGDMEDNRWFFLEGGDLGRSLDCDDYELHGDTGSDDLGGGSQNDNVYGEGWADLIYGGQGSDSLSGGGGDDTIEDNQGPANGAPADFDFGHGGDGNDTIKVQDGDLDDGAWGNAGSNDTCVVDHTSERQSGCE